MSKIEKSSIELMIEEESGRCLEILLKLQKYNWEGYYFMTNYQSKKYPGVPRKRQRYNALQKTTIWKEARLLLKDYFMIKSEGKLICQECNKEIDGSFTLHHIDFYNQANLFTPLFVSFVHTKGCHRKGNPKEWREGR